jgi:hypothetical protein
LHANNNRKDPSTAQFLKTVKGNRSMDNILIQNTACGSISCAVEACKIRVDTEWGLPHRVAAMSGYPNDGAVGTNKINKIIVEAEGPRMCATIGHVGSGCTHSGHAVGENSKVETALDSKTQSDEERMQVGCNYGLVKAWRRKGRSNNGAGSRINTIKSGNSTKVRWIRGAVAF